LLPWSKNWEPRSQIRVIFIYLHFGRNFLAKVMGKSFILAL
jgi:hypothetical protein